MRGRVKLVQRRRQGSVSSVLIGHGDVSLKVIVGTDGGLDASVETPLGNFDWEFFHHDETQGVK